MIKYQHDLKIKKPLRSASNKVELTTELKRLQQLTFSLRNSQLLEEFPVKYSPDFPLS